MASNGRSSNNRNRNNLKPGEIARTAVGVVAELTGRRPETVLGLRKEDEGWMVTVEVVELSRVPNSTDLLGCYAVHLDENGELVGYERVRRYQRGQTGGEEQ
jgi:hypothetical protein